VGEIVSNRPRTAGGPVLQKTGIPRRYRFRFVDPLMQPYTIMHGIKNDLVSADELSR
jgi:hypothetical protein